jgi:hypothetical protein
VPEPPATLRLGYQEAAFLAGFLARLDRWEPGAAVRVQVRGGTLGVYAAPPLGCLLLLVLPTVGPPAADAATDAGGDASGDAGSDAGADDVVLAGRLRDILGDVSARRGPDDVRDVRLPDAVGPRQELALLPPRDGWLPGDRGVAGDVLPRVDQAVADFRTRSLAPPGKSPAELKALAEHVWAGPGWAGVPVQALHAAVAMGLLPHRGMRIAASTAPGWKRLTTPVGQVFVRSGAPPVLTLSVQ